MDSVGRGVQPIEGVARVERQRNPGWLVLRARNWSRVALRSTRATSLALALWSGPVVAGEAPVPVALELVVAIDTSASVDTHEFRLQIEGIAGAFRSPEVIAAIKSSPNGIAVALVQWSERASVYLSLPFQHIVDERTARAFAFLMGLTERRHKAGFTSIGAAIEVATALIEENGFEGRRRTIDVSGDGRSNAAPDPERLRDEAVSRDITVNGLAILTDDPGLAEYYRASVIGGRHAFVEVARDYGSFAEAFERKLVREITPPVTERDDRRMGRAQAKPIMPGGSEKWRVSRTLYSSYD